MFFPLSKNISKSLSFRIVYRSLDPIKKWRHCLNGRFNLPEIIRSDRNGNYGLYSSYISYQVEKSFLTQKYTIYYIWYIFCGKIFAILIFIRCKKFPTHSIIGKIFDFRPKYRFLSKVFDFRQKYRFLSKILIIAQISRFSTKISIFVQNFNYCPNFSIFGQNIDFCRKFIFQFVCWEIILFIFSAYRHFFFQKKK
mgnify:CR=1 FL=1